MGNFFGRLHDHSSLWILRIFWCGWMQRRASFQLSPILPRPVRSKSFPHGILWNSWAPIRIILCLGDNLGQDFDIGSAQKEGLEDA